MKFNDLDSLAESSKEYFVPMITNMGIFSISSNMSVTDAHVRVTVGKFISPHKKNWTNKLKAETTKQFVVLFPFWLAKFTTFNVDEVRAGLPKEFESFYAAIAHYFATNFFRESYEVYCIHAVNPNYLPSPTTK